MTRDHYPIVPIPHATHTNHPPNPIEPIATHQPNPPESASPQTMPPDPFPITPIPDTTLTEHLTALLADSPPNLLERIAARWARLPGPVYDLYVATTHLGVIYVRTSDAVHDDDREFAALFHHRFGQPLLADDAVPSNKDRADRIGFDLSRMGTFEREVLLAVLTIPRGQVRPYDWVAGSVGPQATAYQVDVVLRDNPIPVLIPCHRVINADGTLGEHVFGQHVKRALLAAEGTNLGEVYALAQLDIRYVASDATGTVCFPTCSRARTAARAGFPTVAAARASGYRPCPECRPSPDEAD